MSAALQRLARLRDTLVAALLASRNVDRVVGTAHLTGQGVGYSVHAVYLGLPPQLSDAAVQAARGAALDQGVIAAALAADALDRLADENRPADLAFLEGYAALLLSANAWLGQAYAGDLVRARAGAEWKEWVRTAERAEPRRDHNALEGTIIPVRSAFTLNGRRISGPHDWRRAPDPGEWINCGHGLRYHYLAIANDVL